MAVTQRFSGSKIREARHAAGMTQAALASAAGTRERNIIRWENDQHAPRFEYVAAIAKATGKDISFFVTSVDSSDEDEEESRGMSLDDFLRARIREITREELTRPAASAAGGRF